MVKEADGLLIAQQNFEVESGGRQVILATLTNGAGTSVQITNYGARIVSFIFKDAHGIFRDVIAGPASFEGYKTATERYFNAVIGRYAGRIAGGRFSVDGSSFVIAPNSGGNLLHGGPNGLHETVWEVKTFKKNQLKLTAFQPSSADGFPGDLRVDVKYTLTEEHELEISYSAKSSEDTVINLTNHAFFNLGANPESILDHKLIIDASAYTPLDANLIPTGEIKRVKDTVFDFTQYKTIGADFTSPLLAPTKGYDHNFVLDNYPSRNGAPVFAACAVSPSNGIKLEVFTTEPGIQLYTGNFLNGKDTGKAGVKYLPQSALCLETQHFPDSPNRPYFPSTFLPAGRIFSSITVYKLSAGAAPEAE